jgi:hypothetical protein
MESTTSLNIDPTGRAVRRGSLSYTAAEYDAASAEERAALFRPPATPPGFARASTAVTIPVYPLGGGVVTFRWVEIEVLS